MTETQGRLAKARLTLGSITQPLQGWCRAESGAPLELVRSVWERQAGPSHEGAFAWMGGLLQGCSKPTPRFCGSFF